MIERTSILAEIKSGGYDASLITTFNAFVPFYEDVILRHLMSNGVRHNVLMMDATQAAIELDRHPPRSAGRYYTLAPFKAPGAFHPKVILLVGKNKGTLFVGSHNLTLSGFGYNRELTNLIYLQGKDDIEAASTFSAVWSSIVQWADSQKDFLPAHILDMIEKVKEFAPWLKEGSGTYDEWRILSSIPDAASMWDQLLSFIGAGPVKRVIINGAFFDSKLQFVERVRDTLSPAELIVGIDPSTVQFPVDKKLSSVAVVNCSQLGLDETGKNNGYLHAKSLYIERQDGENVLAVGSANPSYPAWLAPGTTQNIEMMLARKGTRAAQAAADIGLLAIAGMPPLSAGDWETAKQNWQANVELPQKGMSSNVIVALLAEGVIRFDIPGVSKPADLDCEIVMPSGKAISAKARLAKGGYVLPADALETQPSFFRFNHNGSRYTGLIQNVKQIEGLSRTGSQRKFAEALSSLTTSLPNLDHFVDCIRDIIKISDKVSESKDVKLAVRPKKDGDGKKTTQEGALLSIGLADVKEHAPSGKQQLRGSDDLGYLLDVLLYNLRDASVDIDAALEDRDAKGRSEEEQMNQDDEEEERPSPPERPAGNKPPPALHHKSSLDVCHYKVGSLVSVGCDKVSELKKGSIELGQFIIVMAGILSALRLLRGLDGKVPWIAAGQTAVPKKELIRLFLKLAETVFDESRSIISLEHSHKELASTDEFARLKGLIIWLAWECGIDFKDKKPFNESSEERAERIFHNQLYVAVAQLIAKDNVVIGEARQSIGQFSSSDMDWLAKLLAVDALFQSAFADPNTLPKNVALKPGDFGFHEHKPELGVRALQARGGGQLALLHHYTSQPRFGFSADMIRVLSFKLILSASMKR